jgi:hypothetical protein
MFRSSQSKVGAHTSNLRVGFLTYDLRFDAFIFSGCPTLPGLPSAASARRQTGRVGVQTYAVESPLPTYLRDITLLVYENTV